MKKGGRPKRGLAQRRTNLRHRGSLYFVLKRCHGDTGKESQRERQEKPREVSEKESRLEERRPGKRIYSCPTIEKMRQARQKENVGTVAAAANKLLSGWPLEKDHERHGKKAEDIVLTSAGTARGRPTAHVSSIGGDRKTTVDQEIRELAAVQGKKAGGGEAGSGGEERLHAVSVASKP